MSIGSVLSLSHELVEDFVRRVQDPSARAEDVLGAGLEEEGIVLGRDDSTDDDGDAFSAGLLEFLDEFGDEGLMSGCEGTDTDDVHVIVDGHAGGFGGGLEEGADVDIEAQVSEA